MLQFPIPRIGLTALGIVGLHLALIVTSLSAISVRQVAWGTTWWDDTGGTVTLQAFKLDLDGGNGVWSTTPLALETATVRGEPDGVTWNIS